MPSPAERPDGPVAIAGGPSSRCPVVIYDGECGICRRSVAWLERREPGALEFVPLQAPGASQFGIAPERLSRSVHLVEADGRVFSAAAALVRLLARDARQSRWLRWYERDVLFAELGEEIYAFVAEHRFLVAWVLRWTDRS